MVSDILTYRALVSSSFFLLLGCAHDIWKFLGQGLNHDTAETQAAAMTMPDP